MILMRGDPEYISKIQPDKANFIDAGSIRMISGVDYIVMENENAGGEHG